MPAAEVCNPFNYKGFLQGKTAGQTGLCLQAYVAQDLTGICVNRFALISLISVLTEM
jgi:hypothetical protein